MSEDNNEKKDFLEKLLSYFEELLGGGVDDSSKSKTPVSYNKDFFKKNFGDIYETNRVVSDFLDRTSESAQKIDTGDKGAREDLTRKRLALEWTSKHLEGKEGVSESFQIKLAEKLEKSKKFQEKVKHQIKANEVLNYAKNFGDKDEKLDSLKEKVFGNLGFNELVKQKSFFRFDSTVDENNKTIREIVDKTTSCIVDCVKDEKVFKQVIDNITDKEEKEKMKDMNMNSCLSDPKQSQLLQKAVINYMLSDAYEKREELKPEEIELLQKVYKKEEEKVEKSVYDETIAKESVKETLRETADSFKKEKERLERVHKNTLSSKEISYAHTEKVAREADRLKELRNSEKGGDDISKHSKMFEALNKGKIQNKIEASPKPKKSEENKKESEKVQQNTV